jgi:hypothetical protein
MTYQELLENWEPWKDQLKKWEVPDVVVEDTTGSLAKWEGRPYDPENDDDTGIREPDGDDELVQRAIWAANTAFEQFLRKHCSEGIGERIAR